jgi:hypothetical protein
MFLRRLALVVCPLAALAAANAWGFPPYRSTDADTAEPGALEVRLGLLRVEREDHDNAYSSPLLRVNLGLPKNLELISEFEYRSDEGHFGDGAIGVKWVPLRSPISLGIETLVLLPVASGQNGSGVESQLLATFRRKGFLLHLNAGGFYDARPSENEEGWRGSALAEIRKGRFRPGLELFAKQVHSESVQVQAGAGLIAFLGPIDVRTGVHGGLTSEAPDFTASLWMTWKWPLWSPVTPKTR